MGLILLILVILLLVGVLPRWGHSRNWGYGPSGGLGLVLLVVLVLFALQRDPAGVLSRASPDKLKTLPLAN